MGVELAAEVAGRYGRSKRVTIITSRPALLDRMPEAAGRHARAWLERRGVEVVIGQRCTVEAREVSGLEQPEPRCGVVLSLQSQGRGALCRAPPEDGSPVMRSGKGGAPSL